MRILIVEDEEHIADVLKYNFQAEGWTVDTCEDGPSGLAVLDKADRAVDVVVLDLMLPGMSGYETLAAIRQRSEDLPVLILSARNLPQDKAHAFDIGTDQYMTKPFALPELLARMRNLYRRRERQPRAKPAGPETYRFANHLIDFRTFEVTADGTPQKLTPTEMKLLRLFIDNEGTVLSRSRMLEEVWGVHADVTTRTVDNFVMRLRKVFEQDPSHPIHFRSVRGAGYRFVAAPEAAEAVEVGDSAELAGDSEAE